MYKKNGKKQFNKYKPPAKAYQHPIDESGPAIKISRKLPVLQEAQDLLVEVYENGINADTLQITLIKVEQYITKHNLI